MPASCHYCGEEAEILACVFTILFNYLCVVLFTQTTNVSFTTLIVESGNYDFLFVARN